MIAKKRRLRIGKMTAESQYMRMIMEIRCAMQLFMLRVMVDTNNHRCDAASELAQRVLVWHHNYKIVDWHSRDSKDDGSPSPRYVYSDRF